MNELYYKNKKPIEYLKVHTAASEIIINTIFEIMETDQFNLKQKDLIIHNLINLKPQSYVSLNDLEDDFINIFGEDYDIYFNREYKINKYAKGAR